MKDYKEICELGTREALVVRDSLTRKIWSVYEKAGYELDRPRRQIRKDGKVVFSLR